VPWRKAPQLGFVGWDGSDPNGASGSAAVASEVAAGRSSETTFKRSPSLPGVSSRSSFRRSTRPPGPW